MRSASDGLRVKQITAGYGSKVVLDAIEAVIPRGKMIALVGPNGSGKSTLLSTMARLMKPVAGQVCLDGKAIHKMPTRELARKLGILPQNPILPEGMRVFDLVSRGRFPHQGLFKQWSEADEAAVQRAMTLTDTLQFADRKVDDLSGGQRQRCWIAMAIAQDTDIMMLDEPTAFLDMRYQVEILDLLYALTRDHGRTVVVVLHDLNCAITYADMIMFLKDGQLVGDPVPPEACTAQVISSVFDIDVVVTDHPRSGRPFVMPVSGHWA
ncbi:ABC transporter ATP-binding protein [Rhizobium sp. 2MFCol3.1]|uniref:ABC transporter ATP-binding protein n=1 Tax=Rhizobium sp. 2MFCol3.1 TaxID=1246459 RepID=UPI0018CB226D|nr:ABC transporter ATP-binding protein [Rhizobium sp. 2MFCol3.1]